MFMTTIRSNRRECRLYGRGKVETTLSTKDVKNIHIEDLKEDTNPQLFRINSNFSPSAIGGIIETMFNDIRNENRYKSPALMEDLVCKYSTRYEYVLGCHEYFRQLLSNHIINGKQMDVDTYPLVMGQTLRLIDIYNTDSSDDDSQKSFIDDYPVIYDTLDDKKTNIYELTKHVLLRDIITTTDYVTIDTGKFFIDIEGRKHIYRINSELDLNICRKDNGMIYPLKMIELKVCQDDYTLKESMLKYILRIPSFIGYLIHVNDSSGHTYDHKTFVDRCYKTLSENSYYFNILTQTISQFDYTKIDDTRKLLPTLLSILKNNGRVSIHSNKSLYTGIVY